MLFRSHIINECTKVQNPRCKAVTMNACIAARTNQGLKPNTNLYTKVEKPRVTTKINTMRTRQKTDVHTPFIILINILINIHVQKSIINKKKLKEHESKKDVQ